VVICGPPVGKKADALADVLIDTVRGLPAQVRGSLTWDQGTEMARHAALTLATDLPVYFAHPHSPWERGSNENTNGLIREYLPKGIEITSHQPRCDRRRTERPAPRNARVPDAPRGVHQAPRGLRCLDVSTPRGIYLAVAQRSQRRGCSQVRAHVLAAQRTARERGDLSRSVVSRWNSNRSNRS
jgi:hypothetical protein